MKAVLYANSGGKEKEGPKETSMRQKGKERTARPRHTGQPRDPISHFFNYFFLLHNIESSSSTLFIRLDALDYVVALKY